METINNISHEHNSTGTHSSSNDELILRGTIRAAPTFSNLIRDCEQMSNKYNNRLHSSHWLFEVSPAARWPKATFVSSRRVNKVALSSPEKKTLY